MQRNAGPIAPQDCSAEINLTTAPPPAAHRRPTQRLQPLQAAGHRSTTPFCASCAGQPDAWVPLPAPTRSPHAEKFQIPSAPSLPPA